MNYHLSIMTPAGKIFDEKINALMASGETGFFGILGSHAPMVASLRKGPLTVKQDGLECFFAVSSGVLEVNGNSDVLLLADYAIKTDTLGEAKATAKTLN